jgi:signal transduction histidine kinase
MAADDELRQALPYASAWGSASRTLAFRRIVDLLVRARGTGDRGLLAQALATLERLRPQVPPAVRREAMALAAARWPDRAMLWLFRHEPPEDAAVLIDRLRLTEADWRVLSPELPEPMRRRVAEARWTASGHPSIETAAQQVAALAERLRPLAATPSAATAVAGDWRWECDGNAMLVFVDGPAPVAVGDALLELAEGDALWAAFARRTPFRGLAARTGERRFTLAGVPFFERGSGRFLGYRGTGEAVETPGLFGTGASSEALAKVAHEVRSPLNAIMGFAQMIESETLGAAPEPYRRRASAILDNAQRLLSALDDLTDAARLDRGHWSVAPAEVDVGALIERTAERHRALAADRGVSIAVTLAPGLPPALVDEPSLERAVKRLLAAVIAVADSGETLLLGGQRGGDDLRLYLTRPSALDEMSADQLLDTASVAGEGGSAPLLGLGFGLRLVRQLADAMGGSFAIEPHRFALTLPSAAAAQQGVANEDQSA